MISTSMVYSYILLHGRYILLIFVTYYKSHLQNSCVLRKVFVAINLSKMCYFFIITLTVIDIIREREQIFIYQYCKTTTTMFVKKKILMHVKF